MDEWKKFAALNNDPEEVAIAAEATKVYAKSGIKTAIAREIDYVVPKAQPEAWLKKQQFITNEMPTVDG